MDSEHSTDAALPRDESQQGAGARLKRAREAQGLSLADIATRTRIPIRQLEVIESGAFAALPSRTYAIGFARTYARAIGLNDAEITAAVRAELGDAGEVRSAVPGGMEPGDPAKLPSRALAWAGGAGALLLAVGLIAWISSQFRAGEGVPPLVAESEAAVADTAPPAPSATGLATGGTVVFTAIEDGIWVRLFEEGGERFLEKTLAKGESFTVPEGARDPRINTARPDALAVTIDGKAAAPLAARAVVLASEPVSAAALLARAAAAAGAPAADTTPQTERAPAATRRRSAAPRRPEAAAESPSAEGEPAELPAPAPAAAPTPAAAAPAPESQG